MIKLTFCLVRRPEFTREAFQDYWINTHAPLVASVREVLRIRRYVQLHSLPAKVSDQIRATRGGPEGYDGVAQLWWDSLADMALARAEDAGAAASEATCWPSRTCSLGAWFPNGSSTSDVMAPRSR